MKAFEIKFNIWADEQEEADTLSKLLQEIVNDYGTEGIAITALRTTSALETLKQNVFLRTRVREFYIQRL